MLAGSIALVATLASCGGKRDVEKTAGSSESATQTTHRPASDGAGAAPTTTPAPGSGSASGAAQVTTRPKVVNRILIHAIDGATWRIMTPLMEAGRLPNMKRLADAGMRYELATLEPTLSPAIWTTIATGVLPDRHGIHGFEGVPGEGMQTLPNSRMRKMKAYWNILADVGRTSGTVCWWVTWPAESGGAGGYQVSDRVPYNRMEASIGRATLTAQDVNPTELLEPLAGLVVRPDDIEQMAVARFLKFTPEQTDQLLRAAPYKTGDYLSEFKYVYQSDRSILNMGLELLRTRPVDVAAVYFSGVDALSHLYWHWLYPEEFPRFNIPKEHIDRMKDVIPQYYVLMDEYLGRMLDAVGPETTVIIVSDHGFGGTGRNFEKLEEALKHRFTTYAVDIFFHGDSRFPEGRGADHPITPEEFTAIMHAFMDDRSIDNALIMGFSLGGRLALTCIERLPERSSGLWLFAPDGLVRFPWYRAASKWGWGRSLYRRFVHDPSRVHWLFDRARELRFISERRHQFLKGHTSDTVRRQLVYDVWLSLRLLEPDLKLVGANLKRHDLLAEVFLGKYDRVILPGWGRNLVRVAPEHVQLHLLETGHQVVTPELGERLMRLT